MYKITLDTTATGFGYKLTIEETDEIRPRLHDDEEIIVAFWPTIEGGIDAVTSCYIDTMKKSGEIE